MRAKVAGTVSSQSACDGSFAALQPFRTSRTSISSGLSMQQCAPSLGAHGSAAHDFEQSNVCVFRSHAALASHVGLYAAQLVLHGAVASALCR